MEINKKLFVIGVFTLLTGSAIAAPSPKCELRAEKKSVSLDIKKCQKFEESPLVSCAQVSYTNDANAEDDLTAPKKIWANQSAKKDFCVLFKTPIGAKGFEDRVGESYLLPNDVPFQAYILCPKDSKKNPEVLLYNTETAESKVCEWPRFE